MIPQRLARIVTLLLLCLVLAGPSTASALEAGVARADITPTESVPLAGYSGTRLSKSVTHPIWLKALALRDESGTTAVLVTADLVGLSQTMVDHIAHQAEKKHGLSREHLILNTSHNHSSPVTADVLWLYYDFTDSEAALRDRYTHLVYEKYDEVIGHALAALKPAELAFENGLAGFAVNRRRSRGPESRSLPGPVDQDVPVLTLRSNGELRGILFGYSCHTTALSGQSINGDYAGFAQKAVEKDFPGVTALFLQNCGGDANPLPRIRGKDPEAEILAENYGEILAESVRQVVAGKMKPLSGPLRIALDETTLDLQPGLSREEIQQRLPNLSGLHRREFQHFLRQYQSLGSLPDHVRYPVQALKIGTDFTLIALTGETVVDYSLKFKSTYGWNSTWVCGYNNDLLSYVPSLRVLREGGYEGVTGMYEYGHRAPYTESVEDRITQTVDRLLQTLR
jgi:neutral ceramidase